MFICELFGGFTPFHDNDPVIMYENIVNVRIRWPHNLDPVLKDLVAQILVGDPNLRPSIEII